MVSLCQYGLKPYYTDFKYDFQFIEAVEKYRDVLRSVEEHKDTLKTDSLQQLHAMYNLHEILVTKPEGIAPTLRDDQLPKQVQS